MSAHNLIKSYLRRTTKDSLLGVGCYSAAMLANNSRDQVVKIGSTTEDPWVDYYHEVIKGMDTPYTPKVSRFYCTETSGYYVALMERLYPLDDVNKKFISSLRKYVTSDFSYDEFFSISSSMTSIPNAEAFIAFIDYIIARTDVIERSGWDADNDFEDSRTLDIHNDNWMLRKDGTLVLTDPWAHYEVQYDLDRWAEDNLYNKYGYP